MINALRSEWIKLRTLPSSWVLIGCAAGVPILIVLLTVAFSDMTSTGEEMAEFIAGTGVIGGLLLGALGTLAITSEFATNTIRPTFGAMPDRWRPLLAKPIVHVAAAVVVMLVVVIVNWVGGAAMAEGEQAIEGTTLPLLVGLVLLAVGLTLLGYGIGLVVRNTALAISLLLLWPLIGEGLLAGLLAAVGWHGAQKWLPYQAGFRMIERVASDDGLGRVTGGLWFFLWVLIVVAVGIWLAHRRDA